MGAFIARQPNGLLCRFSTIVDTVTHYNMTDEEYVELCADYARVEAKEYLKCKLPSFDEVIYSFSPRNMTETEFNEIVKEMSYLSPKF